MFAGEGAKVEAGDILAVYGAAGEASSFVLYVLAVATDVVTAVHGYSGSPVTVADDLDGVIFEVMGDGSPAEYEIINAVNLVFRTLLFPHIYKYSTSSLTPNLATQRAEVPATVEKIDDMWQISGTELRAIPFGLKKNQNTTVTSTGSFVFTDAYNGSTVYYNYRERYADGDEATAPHLTDLVAMGAAAILAGWARPETMLAATRQDSQIRGQGPDVGATLWRDFLALRDQWADDLARTGAQRIIVDRG